MFAGVTSILLNEEEQIISGISSKEGEEVNFDIIIFQTLDQTLVCMP